jgi:hypothetical protein
VNWATMWMCGGFIWGRVSLLGSGGEWFQRSGVGAGVEVLEILRGGAVNQTGAWNGIRISMQRIASQVLPIPEQLPQRESLSSLAFFSSGYTFIESERE